MRIVFMGTPEFAVPILELICQDHSIVGVYSQPPKPSGRGYNVTKSPVQVWAEHQGIPCFTPKELKSMAVQDELRALQPDVIVVVAYGLILPRAVLDIPAQGCYNIHFSLLPRWRGAALMQRAIQVGDSVTGVTIMKMDVGLDTGPIITQQEYAISPNCTYADLSHHLSVLGGQLLQKTLGTLATTECLKETIQPIEGVTYAHKLKKEEGLLDWTHSALTLQNAIRAFNPWPGTRFTYEQHIIKVLEAAIEDVPLTENATPGLLIDDHLGIVCGGFNPFTASWEPSRILRPLLLQKAGGKAMKAAEFLRGFPMPAGTSVE